MPLSDLKTNRHLFLTILESGKSRFDREPRTYMTYHSHVTTSAGLETFSPGVSTRPYLCLMRNWNTAVPSSSSSSSISWASLDGRNPQRSTWKLKDRGVTFSLKGSAVRLAGLRYRKWGKRYWKNGGKGKKCVQQCRQGNDLESSLRVGTIREASWRRRSLEPSWRSLSYWSAQWRNSRLTPLFQHVCSCWWSLRGIWWCEQGMLQNSLERFSWRNLPESLRRVRSGVPRGLCKPGMSPSGKERQGLRSPIREALPNILQMASLEEGEDFLSPCSKIHYWWVSVFILFYCF